MRNGNGTEKSEVLILLDSRFWGLISIPVMRQGCNRGPPHRRTSGLHLPSWDDNLLPRQKHKKKQVLKTFRRCKSANVIVYLTSPIVDDKIATICALRTLSKNPVCNCWWYKVNTMSLRMTWMLHQMMRKKTWPIQQQAEPASNTTRMVGSNFLKPTILPKSKRSEEVIL